MPIYNFGEFLRFFLKGLNPFKMQIKFKFYIIFKFVIQNLFQFWNFTQKESCSISSVNSELFMIFRGTGIGLKFFENRKVGAAHLSVAPEPLWHAHAGDPGRRQLPYRHHLLSSRPTLMPPLAPSLSTTLRSAPTLPPSPFSPNEQRSRRLSSADALHR
jgi:hypothetical protein